MMLLEDQSKFDFVESVDRFSNAVESHGWKISKVHDLKKTMKKFGNDVDQVKVFETCHPDHAFKVLAKDDERVVSSLMPCRVAIYEHSNGDVYASRLNSGLMGQMMDGVIPEPWMLQTIGRRVSKNRFDT